MKLRILGKCRPGKLFGCDPVDSAYLEQLVYSVAQMKQTGIEHNILRCQHNIPLPPNSVNSILAVVADPRNPEYGLFHWKEMQTIWLKTSTLERVVNLGLFSPGDPYSMLVKGLAKLGLESYDIELYGEAFD